MAGVSNYYHGETGLVSERTWLADDEQLFYLIRLDENPHRKYVGAYGSDIRIDPAIVTGDRVSYVRLDGYCGLWVREADAQFPRLQDARRRSDSYDRILRDWRFDLSGDAPPDARGGPLGMLKRAGLRIGRSIYLRRLHARTGIPTRIIKTGQPWFEDAGEESAKQATFFLSYSSRNALMARQLFEDITAATDVDVWFDLARAGETPGHQKHIEEWLSQAVNKSRGFVVLLTKASARSQWVKQEISWALERARAAPDFQLIVLKLEDVPVPAAAAGCGRVIDGEGLWWAGGIVEELYAAVYGRRGRQAWLKEHDELGVEKSYRDSEVFHYEDYASEAGVAQELRTFYEGGHLYWELSYRRGGRVYKVRHMGMQCAVDLGIKKGDWIASFVCHRNRLGRFLSGIPVWMRSDVLSLSPDEVIGRYMEKVPEEDRLLTMPHRPGTPPPVLYLDL